MNSHGDLAGRTCVVTGANSGLGLEATRELARRGATVTLVCRDTARGEAAADDVRSSVSGAQLHVVRCDLSSLDSVRAAAAELRRLHPRLHVLVNNAGVMAVPHRRSADGHELHFAVNHLGHFALTGLLLASLTPVEGSRVVTVASMMYRFARLDFHDLQFDHGYNRWRAYSTSKLENLLFTHELQRRLSAARHPTIAVACHPGYAATNLSDTAISGVPQPVQGLVRRAAQTIAQSPARGAEALVRAATDPSLRGGEFIGPTSWMGMRGSPGTVELRSQATDVHDALELWKRSVELTGVDPLGTRTSP